MSDELITYNVRVEYREYADITVKAENEDEAIKLAMSDADLDYDGTAEFVDIWEK